MKFGFIYKEKYLKWFGYNPKQEEYPKLFRNNQVRLHLLGLIEMQLT